MTDMKTFNDLTFMPHSIDRAGRHALLFFDNGYGVSVVSGPLFYTDAEHPYEVAVLIGTEADYNLCYTTDITDDVIGHCTAEEVTEIMSRVQGLKRKED